MHYVRGKKRQKGLQVLHLVAFICAVLFLASALVVLVANAFEASLGYGIRSLAACVLPVLFTAYVGSSTQVLNSDRQNQNFNLFFIYAVWTMMLLVFGNTWQVTVVPLFELFLSTTLTSILWRLTKFSARNKVFACSYGVLMGLLCYTALFGAYL